MHTITHTHWIMTDLAIGFSIAIVGFMFAHFSIEFFPLIFY